MAAPFVPEEFVVAHILGLTHSLFTSCDRSRYRIGGGQITPVRSYLDQGGTTPLVRAYAIDCPRCSC